MIIVKNSDCFPPKHQMEYEVNISFRLINQKLHQHTISNGMSGYRSAIDRLSIIWKSNQSDKIKPNCSQAEIVSILMYGGTTWTLPKHIEKKLNGKCTRILQATLNKSRKQHPQKRPPTTHLKNHPN